MKIFFFENIIASDYSYEQSLTECATIIKFKTPEDYSFRESEIPITITTEGASYDQNW